MGHTRKVEISDRDGKVMFDMGGDDVMVIPPEQAVFIAETLLHAASACGYKVQVKVPQIKVSETKYTAMVNRTTHVMRSLTQQKKPPAVIAAHAVDTVLSMLI